LALRLDGIKGIMAFLLVINPLFSFFVRPKKEPKKGRRKRKIQPFYPPATQSHNGATKKVEFHTVSGFADALLDT
jgi:hypothetical protein